ncbi:hypothetical protein Ccrd_025391 [Cynara cardunculus var. scolymus]|uniref:Uncharacterized protein n=1 Tax=Cynara cardunculus var. scolymus TaxID=59895 RepID=A0A103XAY9_CYNCS|nr:hypothetical protein Ccrd_025391 [Cynara cardunculus var. scolymus]
MTMALSQSFVAIHSIAIQNPGDKETKPKTKSVICTDCDGNDGSCRFIPRLIYVIVMSFFLQRKERNAMRRLQWSRLCRRFHERFRSLDSPLGM